MVIASLKCLNQRGHETLVGNTQVEVVSTKRKISKAIKSAKEKQKGALNKYFKRTKSESSGESGQENDSNMLQDRQQSTALQYYPLRVMRQNISTSKIF